MNTDLSRVLWIVGIELKPCASDPSHNHGLITLKSTAPQFKAIGAVHIESSNN